MNVKAAQVLKPPTTSCSPALPLMLWDTRHGSVWWMPTGSFGDWLRHCIRLWTSPYSPDWRSSTAENTEETRPWKGNLVSYKWGFLITELLISKVLSFIRRRPLAEGICVCTRMCVLLCQATAWFLFVYKRTGECMQIIVHSLGQNCSTCKCQQKDVS